MDDAVEDVVLMRVPVQTRERIHIFFDDVEVTCGGLRSILRMWRWGMRIRRVLPRTKTWIFELFGAVSMDGLKRC